MKNYDDLQRFKEKTQTLDIAFKDMSGQSQEADQSQWALLRQLATDQEPELGSGQRIDMPQPQPISGDEFSAPPAPVQTASMATSRGSILDSVSASAAVPAASSSSLFPPAPAKSAPASMPLAPKATLVERQAATSLFPPAKPAAAPAVQPAAAAEPALIAPAPVAPAPLAVAPASTFAAPVEPARPAASAPSRFGALFRSRPAESANLAKETPLKPLLEKIALCR
ncbi:cellulose biosynthesis protein BcsO [Pantoea sp. BIGb0393]|uniref:Cellulose biosynthesis protein BcsO n=1 Tax=Pantoea nemavictus TaxID=2726955 RepID=A0ABU8PUE8_9GAMM|nr:cellulose biosynthesis protein BcsO [Pantoea nemavictus]MBA0036589.1 cellulose biosynthesis protein BcsO [Pantoea nemavictus]